MRVLIVDDHELFRAGLALLLRELFPDIELLHASTLSQGLNHALGEFLNIVFLDLDLPDGHGYNALAELKESRPSLPVIVISADESVETISRCIELRAMGYVPKSSPSEALHAAISAALAGGVFLPASSIAKLRHDMGTDEAPANNTGKTQSSGHSEVSNATELGLTPREFETLAWLVRGLPSKAIALRMGLEDITVRKYVSHLLAHFNLRRRTELIVMLADSGIKLGVPPVTDPAHDQGLSAGGRQGTD
ncbi:DNA-binding transcriptional activator DevR/DosR [Paraburkholderia nemoris]|uniref:response regulator transcription factor n=1 Tax=Paraburkholderia nemoris TaxID=2793076 RepID=UPI00190C7039|nr:response regulator transcription factor [Paraburkholderia nemoris]MBK3738784.1 response regulator transcription factor [Paraburkholderia aspalathi]CAE6793157.1 DNA-binding transcriptional activator DevR/DosR [Paraburkholderia nemoris]